MHKQAPPKYETRGGERERLSSAIHYEKFSAPRLLRLEQLYCTEELDSLPHVVYIINTTRGHLDPMNLEDFYSGFSFFN